MCRDFNDFSPKNKVRKYEKNQKRFGEEKKISPKMFPLCYLEKIRIYTLYSKQKYLAIFVFEFERKPYNNNNYIL